MERRAIAIRGIVQGVGFRPFVYGLASRLSLSGFVRNQAGSVLVEVEGDAGTIDRFIDELTNKPPPLAQIDAIDCHDCPPRGQGRFEIWQSESSEASIVSISPDIAVCDDCLNELFDPSDRRWRYPFINCTNCGPRLTIIRGAPYDRARTTMASFEMCPECREEYENPLDRRFHAQPIACARCGPRLMLLNSRGAEDSTDDPLGVAVEALRRGMIVAIKGLGGFHLACDARSDESVRELRRRKHRDEKPLAVMTADVPAARAFAEIGEAEAMLLQSRARPIVLVRKLGHCHLAAPLAPGNPFIGVMLPYTPLHHLLLRDLGGMTLVMTSGNRSDEPIAYEDADAVERLSGIADLFLTHNRGIHVRCDDSVTRVVVASTPDAGTEAGAVVGAEADANASAAPRAAPRAAAGAATGDVAGADAGEAPHLTSAPAHPVSAAVESPIRRSRGYAPQPLQLPLECPEPILAVGGQLKATFALGRDHQAILSHHLGDLDHLEAYLAFQRDIELYEQSFQLRPRIIAHDLHPDYASTRYARQRSQKQGVKLIAVQHHHAHMASCMAEHGIDEPVIGVSFDGTGYGTDGAIWGGEFLVGDLRSFRRAAHLRYVPMPGGERAIKEPWRMALVYLEDAGVDVPPLLERIDPAAMRIVRQALHRKLNCPLTSSAGRLFDAVASILAVRDRVSFEGQAAMELEWMSSDACDARIYPYDATPVADTESPDNPVPFEVDLRPMIRQIVQESSQGVAVETIASRFHATLAQMIADVCVRIRGESRIDRVVLSGGVFMNQLLTASAKRKLQAEGFCTLSHRLVPTNDAGLSLGQIAVAAKRLATGDSR